MRESLPQLAVSPWDGSFFPHLVYPVEFSDSPVTMNYNVFGLQNSAPKWHNLHRTQSWACRINLPCYKDICYHSSKYILFEIFPVDHSVIVFLPPSCVMCSFHLCAFDYIISVLLRVWIVNMHNICRILCQHNTASSRWGLLSVTQSLEAAVLFSGNSVMLATNLINIIQDVSWL